LDRSAIILAGGSSTRFGEDKGVIKLGQKPLIRHAVDTVSGLVEEIIIVTNSKERANTYSKLLPANVKFTFDSTESNGPLIGALAGFETAQGKYSLLLPFDAPFASKEVISLLFELCIGKTATIPRWPNDDIEPLHAVYQTKAALEAAKKVVDQGELRLRVMIEELRGVRYISTLVIEQLDPELRTFFNVNTPLDLKKAASMLQPRKTHSNKKPF
jgi:molybdopterin-guanine dinucleotide biosynthesis protein A